jgi:flagellum-specific peptidoglycan hydrolase FlgJ
MIPTINAIITAAKKYNLPASVLVAQAILETGWFKRYKKNNIFGIKASQKDIAQGRYFTTPTIEYINGQKITAKLKFAKFSSIDEAVKRYNEIIKRNFPEADKNRNNSMLFLQGLFSGKLKYATDPRYIDKIKQILVQLKKKFPKSQTSANNVFLGGIVLLTILTFFNLQKKR